jgi:hypothetical protein
MTKHLTCASTSDKENGMSHRGEGTICTNAGLVLPALALFSFPLEVLRIVAWMWLTATIVLSVIAVAVLAVRSLILPYTHPELYRLIRSQRIRASA